MQKEQANQVAFCFGKQQRFKAIGLRRRVVDIQRDKSATTVFNSFQSVSYSTRLLLLYTIDNGSSCSVAGSPTSHHRFYSEQ